MDLCQKQSSGSVKEVTTCKLRRHTEIIGVIGASDSGGMDLRKEEAVAAI